MDTNLIIEKIEPAIEQLAVKLGVASENVWEILIRQQYVEAIQAFVFLGLLIGIAYLIIKSRIIQNLETQELDGLIIFGGIIYAFFFIIGIAMAYGGIGQIINPEYYAIQQITEFIGNLSK